jgi:hypothetical protein
MFFPFARLMYYSPGSCSKVCLVHYCSQGAWRGHCSADEPEAMRCWACSAHAKPGVPTRRPSGLRPVVVWTSSGWGGSRGSADMGWGVRQALPGHVDEQGLNRFSQGHKVPSTRKHTAQGSFQRRLLHLDQV